MIALEGKSNSVSDGIEENMESESNSENRRFIYFNPNFCINNINVKELVLRAEQHSAAKTAGNPTPQTSSSSVINQPSRNPTTTLPSSSPQTCGAVRDNPVPVQAGPSNPAKKPALLPTPAAGQFVVPPPKRKPVEYNWIRDKPFYETDVDWNDHTHPWYPRGPMYGTNLLSLAADYVKRPNQLPRCRLPPLSKRELAFRMERVYKTGKLTTFFKPPAVIEKFIRFMNLIKDQIEFDMLRIDYTKNQSYAECRRKRTMMQGLGVNQFHYVNEKAVEELFARSQNLKGYKQHIRKNLDLSKLDTSKLSSNQRRFLFKHHVLNQGKAVYKRDTHNDESLSKAVSASSNLVSVNKFKVISKDSLVKSRKSKIRLSLRYRRSEDPTHQDCRFFIKTGKCKFGTRCIRKHDPAKLPSKLKKAAARRRPKSTFSVVNNMPPIPRRPHSCNTSTAESVDTFATTLTYDSTPPPLIPVPPSPRPSPVTPMDNTTRIPTKTKSTVPGRGLYKTDYRFINNPKLGPTRVGLNKKLVNRALKWKKKTATRRKQDCMFFIRRGKCAFGEECRKRHDPDKVALCSKFIFFGRCVVPQCPYQHKLIKEKMPLCLYFYANKCEKENCPFLHIKLGTDVPVCEKFTAGHCDRGSNCTKRHTRDCETHFTTGFCLDTDCKLLHEKVYRSRTYSFSSIDNAMDMDRPYFDGDDFIPIGGLSRIEASISPDILRMLDSDVESVMSTRCETPRDP